MRIRDPRRREGRDRRLRRALRELTTSVPRLPDPEGGEANLGGCPGARSATKSSGLTGKTRAGSSPDCLTLRFECLAKFSRHFIGFRDHKELRLPLAERNAKAAAEASAKWTPATPGLDVEASDFPPRSAPLL